MDTNGEFTGTKRHCAATEKGRPGPPETRQVLLN